MTDTQLLNALERFIKKNGGLVIHDRGYSASAYPGLGLLHGRRNLRQAIQSALGVDPETAPATSPQTPLEAKRKEGANSADAE